MVHLRRNGRIDDIKAEEMTAGSEILPHSGTYRQQYGNVIQSARKNF